MGELGNEHSLVSKSEVKEQCGTLRYRFDDIIKGDLKETTCDIVN